jgi:geranylgeranyl diphosphate synthase type II
MSDIREYFETTGKQVDQWLEALVPPETAMPPEIHRAIRYSLFAGGKRLRPILTLAVGEAFGAPREWLFPPACAIEMIHTYSLIHDDLPAIDNDDYRRGRPTSHKVFGEALAILAGDALFTQAFKTLADFTIDPRYLDRKLQVISVLANAVGTIDGMVGGQVMDILSEGNPVNPTTLEYIHRSKTGALMCACVKTGGVLGGADEIEMSILTTYGRQLGLAFQIVDDLLDATSTTEQLGKTAGKDQTAQKATYPGLYGIPASWAQAEALVQEAVTSIRQLERPSDRLAEIAWFIIQRRS